MIRPLAYVADRDLARYARARRFPIIPCTLCGSQENAQRRVVKRMLADWEREYPGRTESIFSALCNVEASHLADPRLFDFASLALAQAHVARMRAMTRTSTGCSRRRRRRAEELRVRA